MHTTRRWQAARDSHSAEKRDLRGTMPRRQRALLDKKQASTEKSQSVHTEEPKLGTFLAYEGNV